MRLYLAGNITQGDWRFILFPGIKNNYRFNPEKVSENLMLCKREYVGPFPTNFISEGLTYDKKLGIQNAHAVFVWIDDIQMQDGLKQVTLEVDHAHEFNIPVFVVIENTVDATIQALSLTEDSQIVFKENCFEAWKWFTRKLATIERSKRIEKFSVEAGSQLGLPVVGLNKEKGEPATYEQLSYIQDLLRKKKKMSKLPIEELTKKKAGEMINSLLYGKIKCEYLQDASK